VVGGNLTAVALTASTTSAMLTAVFYVHDSLGLRPATGALLFPAFNIAVIGGSVLGPRLLARLSPRVVLLSGFIIIGVGVGLLFLLAPHGPVGVLICAFVVTGCGLGAASVASTTAGTAFLTAADRGVGSGLLNSTAQLGNAIGLAVTAPLVASIPGMTGYRLGFTVAAVVAVTGVLAAHTVPRRMSRPEQSPRSEADLGRNGQTTPIGPTKPSTAIRE
jgi:MFS family permease